MTGLEDKSRVALPERGSVMSFVPDSGWAVEFKTATETWTQVVVGWAVVVSSTDYDGKMNFGNPSNYETRLEPMVVWDGFPVPVSAILGPLIGGSISHTIQRDTGELG